MALLFILLMVALAASCDSSGSVIRENPFEDVKEKAAIEVSTSSSADTVFISWAPKGNGEFDGYKVTCTMADYSKTFAKSATGCFITRFPYLESVKVIIDQTLKGETVSQTIIYPEIDGLDSHFLKKLMPDDGSSVSAGDGMYSVALPDGRSIFLIGDSFVTPVVNGARSKSAHMYRNTYIVYDPKTSKATPIYEVNGPNTSAAVPPGHPYEDRWYWPGDGFVMDGNLYVFQSVMYMAGEGMWGFAFDRVHLLQYSLPDIKLVRDEPINFYSTEEIHYGAAAMTEGDYVYIYAQVDLENGLDPKTAVYCARATKDNLWGAWEYYNGSDWVTGSSAAAELKGLSSIPVSSQFNVFKLRDKYVLLSENKKLWVHEIYTFVSDTPYGPWSHKRTIYTVPNFADENLMCYNAMAHPQFEKDDMILISYDMNTSSGDQQAEDVSTYRPRFFWMPIENILD